MKIIMFTGLSASGKSLLAREAALGLNCPLIEFHQLMHEEAQARGYSRIRDWMKEIGGFDAALKETRGALLRRVQGQKDGVIIVDQLIDSDTLRSLESLSPEKDSPYIIFVKSNRHDRRHWAKKRDPENGIRDLILKDNLKFQVGIREVIEEADLVITNDRPFKRVAEGLVQYLKVNILGESLGKGLERNS